MKKGPYGNQYYIEKSSLAQARQEIEVVPFKKEVTPEGFALMLRESIQDVLKEESAILNKKIVSLSSEVTSLTLEIDKLRKEMAASQNKHLEEEIARNKEILRIITDTREFISGLLQKKPWWRFWEKRNLSANEETSVETK